MRYLNISNVDVNNGEGCRVSLWVSGCTHHCKGCHNFTSWNFNQGDVFDNETKDKLYDLISKPFIKGLTLTGGDPIDSYDDVLELVKDFKKTFTDKDIWLYTGYTIEQLNENGKNEILRYIDVLVDGEYKEELRDVSLPFRGSSNQRIIRLNEK